LKVDLHNRVVSIDDQEIHLTPIPYRLLAVLVKHAGQGVDPSANSQRSLGPSYSENAHYLRIYMSQLRQKLEADSTQPKFLLTGESGVGYRLKVYVGADLSTPCE